MHLCDAKNGLRQHSDFLVTASVLYFKEATCYVKHRRQSIRTLSQCASSVGDSRTLQVQTACRGRDQGYWSLLGGVANLRVCNNCNVKISFFHGLYKFSKPFMVSFFHFCIKVSVNVR
jgi:hypothetical protein